MTDISISVGAKDEGASALIDKIVAALERLRAAQATLSSLQGQQQARDAQGRFMSKERTAAIQAQAQAEVASSKATVSALGNIVKMEAEATRAEKARADAARATAAASIASSNAQSAASRATAAQANAQAGAYRAAAAASQASAASSRTAAAQAVAGARTQASAANAQAAASRLQTAQVRAQAQAAQATANAQLQQARAQQQAQRIAASAAQQAQRQQFQLAQAARSGGDQFERFRNIILRWAAAFQGVHLFGAFLKEGIEFNQIIETATLGIASIITATNEVKDANGKVLTGAQALGGAYALASDQIQKIRIAGLETAATTEQLVESFQSATGPGLAAGLSLDEVRQFSVQIVQAAAAIGVPMNQLNQEVRSILDKTIDRNSRIAKTVGITNENIRQWQQQNILAQKLNEKMASFTEAGKEAAKTMQVVKSNLKEAFQVFAGTATRPLFEQLRQRGFTLLQQIFDTKNLRISDQFLPIVTALQGMFKQIGAFVVEAVDASVKGLTNLATWLQNNDAEVTELGHSVAFFFRQIGQLIVTVFRMVTVFTQWTTQTGLASAALSTVANLIHAAANPAMLTLLGTTYLIVKAVDAWKAAEIARAAATTAANTAFLSTPIGKILLGIAAAAVLVNFAIDIFAQRNRLAEETARKAALQFQNNSGRTIQLAGSYLQLVKASQQLGLTEQERADFSIKLAAARSELIKRDSAYLEILKDTNLTYDQQKDAIIAIARAKVTQMQVEFQEQKIALDSLRAQKESAEAQAQIAEEEAKQARSQVTPLGSRASVFAMQAAEARAASLRKVADGLGLGLAAMNKQVGAFAMQAGIAALQFDDLIKQLNAGASLKPKPRDIQDKSAKNDAKQLAAAAIEELRAQLKTQEDSLKASLNVHAVSFEEYFRRLNELQQREADAEVSVQKKLLSVTTDVGDRGKILADIEKVHQTRRQQIIENGDELVKLQRDLDKSVLAAQVDLLRAQGRFAEAALVHQEGKYREEISQLIANRAGLLEVERQTGHSRAGEIAVIERQITTFQQLEERERVKAIIDGAKQEGAAIKTSLDERVQQIQNANQAGLISSEEAADQTVEAFRQANKQIIALMARVSSLRQVSIADLAGKVLEKQTDISQLKQDEQTKIEEINRWVKQQLDLEISAGMLVGKARIEARSRELRSQADTQIDAIRKATEARVQSITNELEKMKASVADDPALQQALKEILDLWNQIQKGTRDAEDATHLFRNSLLDIIATGFGDFLQLVGDSLANIIVQNKSATESMAQQWANLALSIVKDIERIIVKLLEYKILMALLPKLGFGEETVARIGKIVLGGFAGGGYVKGPGGPTSDSILAPVSNGEYVIKAAVVQQLGVPFFDLINRGFAAHAVAKRTPYRGYADGGLVQAEPQVGGRAVVEIVTTDDHVARVLESDVGVNIQLRNTQRNRKGFKTILGVPG